MKQQSTRRFLRLHDVKQACGYQRSAIYAKIQAGEFPKPYSLGPRAVGWLEEEILAWQDSRIQTRSAK